MLKTLHFKPFILALTALLSACGSSDTGAAPKTKDNLTASNNEQAADPYARGKKVYTKCKTCHTLDEGGANKLGPNLHDLWGKKAGYIEDFNYSKAMLESDVVWSDETLDKFIENPVKYIPGTRMSFVGVRNADDRKALIEYLHHATKP